MTPPAHRRGADRPRPGVPRTSIATLVGAGGGAGSAAGKRRPAPTGGAAGTATTGRDRGAGPPARARRRPRHHHDDRQHPTRRERGGDRPARGGTARQLLGRHRRLLAAGARERGRNGNALVLTLARHLRGLAAEGRVATRGGVGTGLGATGPASVRRRPAWAWRRTDAARDLRHLHRLARVDLAERAADAQPRQAAGDLRRHDAHVGRPVLNFLPSMRSTRAAIGGGSSGTSLRGSSGGSATCATISSPAPSRTNGGWPHSTS